MEYWHEINNRIGQQVAELIKEMHGSKDELPFILIMAPVDPETEAQLVTNIDSVKYLQKTLRYLDESLSKVKKLENANPPVQ